MDEKETKAEMRLWALEILTVNMFVMLCAEQPNPDEAARSIEEQMLSGAKQKAFPGFDAAESDLLSAELESALTRLMDMGKMQRTRLPKQKRATQ